MILLQVAAAWLDWLDSYGWVVALGVAVLVFVVSMLVGRRPTTIPQRPRGGFAPEVIARRTTMFAEAGASTAVADALAQGDRILAIKRYREERDAGLGAGARAIDALLAEVVKKPLIAAGASPAVANALAHGNRFHAIKLYRQEQHVGLRDAAEAIDRLVRSGGTSGTAET